MESFALASHSLVAYSHPSEHGTFRAAFIIFHFFSGSFQHNILVEFFKRRLQFSASLVDRCMECSRLECLQRVEINV